MFGSINANAVSEDSDFYTEDQMNLYSKSSTDLFDNQSHITLKPFSDLLGSDKAVQDAGSYNNLKNYLIDNGRYNSVHHSYRIEMCYNLQGIDFYSSITYLVDGSKLLCSSTYVNGLLNVFMTLTPDPSTGYQVKTVFADNSYSGSSTVYPASYTDILTFDIVDNNDAAVDDNNYDDLFNSAFSASLSEWNYLMSAQANITLGSFGFTNLYSTTPNSSGITTYTVSYDANGGTGAPSTQTKAEDVFLVLSKTKPTRDGYVFLGWSTSSTATTVVYSASGTYTANAGVTLYAVWSTNADLITGPPTIKIANNTGKTTQTYKTLLVLTAQANYLPDGAQIMWYYNGQKSSITEEQCVVNCITDGVVSVKILDANGDVLVDTSNQEIADSETVYVNAGFFERLLAFFRELFFGYRFIYQ